MRASKSPHRSNGKNESIKFESIKSVFNHLIDAGKKKPASIKWEERIDQGESTKAVRIRTYDQTKMFEDLKVQKHKKNAFRRIRLNVPGFVDPVIRSARISGRLFVRLKIGFLHFFDQTFN